MKRDRKVQSRRYYYQNALQKPISIDGRTLLFKVNGVTKHIECPFTYFLDIPKPWRFYVGQLIKHWGYNVQYKLMDVAPKIPPADDQKPAVKKQKLLKKATGQLQLL